MRRWCQAVIFAPPLLTASREGKVLRLAEGVTHSRIMGRNGLVETIRLSITPTANRNSYRVAWLVGAVTQGSVLRPQPWAGETQLRQSCCCLKIAYNNSPRCFCLRFLAYNNSPCCFCLLGHASFSLYLFTINTWMGGEIGTAIIIIMIYYKKNGASFRAN